MIRIVNLSSNHYLTSSWFNDWERLLAGEIRQIMTYCQINSTNNRLFAEFLDFLPFAFGTKSARILKANQLLSNAFLYQATVLCLSHLYKLRNQVMYPLNWKLACVRSFFSAKESIFRVINESLFFFNDPDYPTNKSLFAYFS